MDVCVMGTVQIRDGDRVVLLHRGGERCVLATLALAAGHRVAVSTLIDHIWEDGAPDNAERTVASYTRAVRRAIESGGGERGWLRTHRPGAYQLDVHPDVVDYHRFAALVDEARRHERAGDPRAAVTAYRTAVALRRGEALTGVPGTWAQNRRYAMEQEYLDALCAMYGQQLVIGEYAAVATSAMGLLAEVVPTDRMIVLGARALAGSGQHAAITGFLDRASQRMRELADAVPGPQALAIVRQLLARPDSRFDPVPDPAGSDIGSTDGHGSTIVLNASHNGTVTQAAGDIFIVES